MKTVTGRSTLAEGGGLPVQDRPARAVSLGISVDSMSLDETATWILGQIEAGFSVRQISLNAAKAVQAQNDQTLRRYLEDAEIVSPDGQSIVWVCRAAGQRMSGRVAGIDLMHVLLSEAAARAHRVYFIGARPDVLTAAVASLRAKFPGLDVAGSRDGYFEESEVAAISAEIVRCAPTMVFVALGTPEKEMWVTRCVAQLNVPFAMGIGGTLDVVAGARRRAPRALQVAGLEWMFRMLQEPRRLGPRYLKTNTTFAQYAVRDVVAARLKRHA